ncbi:MAG: hypothetical protein NW703_04540 [Nitrospiraceae bacterium]
MNPARYVLVFAQAGDEVAAGFVRRNARRAVRLVTPRELSRAGWRLGLHRGTASVQAVVKGRIVPQSRLAGVITRLGCVTAADVPHIAAGDRVYVAAEMQAFLVAWLHLVSCPVLNRPTPMCLAGNAWSSHKWVQTAVRLGIPVSPIEQRVDGMAPLKNRPPAGRGVSTTAVTIVGPRAIGTVSPCLVQRARMLTRAAGLEFATVQFSTMYDDAIFLGVSLWPDLADEAIAEAVLRYLWRQSQQIPGITATA